MIIAFIIFIDYKMCPSDQYIDDVYTIMKTNRWNLNKTGNSARRLNS